MTRRAFTLIELLVAVGIVALLLSILVPALAGARRQGGKVVCQSNLRQMSQALWAYSNVNNSRVPYVFSPITNGGSVPGFGNDSYTDDEIDPYNVGLWPESFQNLMMPLYLGADRRLFICPAANRGWPRNVTAFQMTYRDAGVNQPNGLESPEDSYFRENFGFMDGRPMKDLWIRLTGDPIQDSQMLGRLRSTYMRDMILRDGEESFVGPHDGGINVINREFAVEFRNRSVTTTDLGGYGGGVEF